MVAIEKKLELLDVIYRVFDDFVAHRYRMACTRGCAVCCTHDVTGTTLEAHRLLDSLRKSGRQDLLDRLPETAQAGLFRPRLTTNTLAMACLSRREPPDESPGRDQGPCPLLEEDACPVYRDRPFACRSMFSQRVCPPGGEGEIPPELVTISTICSQIIEHLDNGGIFGNMTDLLMALQDANTGFRVANGEKIQLKGHSPNKPVPGLLVPQEHQAAVQGFLNVLFSRDCGGRTFREAMSEVRDSPF
nr:YkgJ family cysteine cluster protein [uncultured Sphaerochaeta sp.]